MNKVYAVAYGYYSDYHINAVFSTKEKAQEYVDEANKHREYKDDFSIETWIIDDDYNWGWETRVHMKRNGDVIRVWNRWMENPPKVAYGHLNFGGDLIVTVNTDSEERAVKVANEIRRQMIAEGEWE